MLGFVGSVGELHGPKMSTHEVGPKLAVQNSWLRLDTIRREDHQMPAEQNRICGQGYGSLFSWMQVLAWELTRGLMGPTGPHGPMGARGPMGRKGSHGPQAPWTQGAHRRWAYWAKKP